MRSTDLENCPPASTKPNYMQQDLRDSELWHKVDDYLKLIFDPAIDKVSAARDLAASPDGKLIAFTGTINGSNWRETSAKHRICLIDVETAALEVITSGASDERLPKWSPDGQTLAFLSDREEKGIYQLYLLRIGRLGEAKSVPFARDMVEDFHWSPDGSRILLHAAGFDADRDDGSGSGKVGQPKKDLPSWMPAVDRGDFSNAWRTLWVYDLKEEELSLVRSERCNPWEAAWCGPNSLLSICSDSPLEDAWYNATLRTRNLDDSSEKVIYVPKRQLGCPVASPSGRKIAVIEGVASDRGLVAGDIKIIDPETGTIGNIYSGGIDVTQLIWRDENCLFYIGLRGLDTVAVQYPPHPLNPHWESHEICGLPYPSASLLPNGNFAAVLQGWSRPPEISLQGQGKSKTLLSFNHDGYKSLFSNLGPMEPFYWRASDGLELQGFLHLPKRNVDKSGLIALVHGGPVYLHMNTSPGLGLTALLNGLGYAVFRPNPRGSSGRGQNFAEHVVGDMGGKDAQDILSGIKAVCESDPALFDTNRISIVGGSYGGFMASLLPTLDPCFKASVSLSAVTDWHSFHTTTNIPEFDRLFLDADPYSKQGGRYLERSPLMNVGKYKTPVLQITGANDLAVPSTQAVQYHRACLEKGVDSAIAIYPGEGHGVQNFPALIDMMVRVAGWFDRYMPA